MIGLSIAHNLLPSSRISGSTSPDSLGRNSRAATVYTIPLLVAIKYILQPKLSYKN